MTRPILLTLCCAALSACATSPGGGDRYRYPEARTGAGKTVRYASTDGRFVGLSDGSVWNIGWQDARAASSLRAGQPVQVQRAGGGNFPYRIATPDGRAVSARYGKKLD